MTVKILIPTPLRRVCDGETELEFDLKKDPTTYDEVLKEVIRRYPGIKETLYIDGHLNRFVNHFIDQEDIRFLNGLESLVKDGTEISIVPSIAGGAYNNYCI